jgi:hypothetical protein
MLNLPPAMWILLVRSAYPCSAVRVMRQPVADHFEYADSVSPLASDLPPALAKNYLVGPTLMPINVGLDQTMECLRLALWGWDHAACSTSLPHEPT